MFQDLPKVGNSGDGTVDNSSNMQILTTFGIGDGNSVVADHTATRLIITGNLYTNYIDRLTLSINGTTISLSTSDLNLWQNHSAGYGYGVILKNLDINVGDTVSVSAGTNATYTVCF